LIYMSEELQKKIYLLKELELLAMRLGIQIRYEYLADAKSGLCILKGKTYLIIDTQTKIDDKLAIFKNILSKEDLSNIFITPIVREFLSCG